MMAIKGCLNCLLCKHMTAYRVCRHYMHTLTVALYCQDCLIQDNSLCGETPSQSA